MKNIISKNIESRTVWCDFNKQYIRITEVEITFVIGNVVQTLKQHFDRGCETFCLMETIKEVKIFQKNFFKLSFSN